MFKVGENDIMRALARTHRAPIVPIHGFAIIAGLAALIIVGAETTANALGESAPAEIVPNPKQALRSQGVFMDEEARVKLHSDSILDLALHSVVEGVDGREVAATASGKSVVSEEAGRLSFGPDVAVAGKGDVVRLSRNRAMSLLPGVYSEINRVAVTDSRFTVPVVISSTRFFRVTDNGVEDISAADYSEVVDGRPVPGFDREGKVIMEDVGKSLPASDPRSKGRFGPRYGADGKITNLDEPSYISNRAPVGDESNEP